MSSYSSECSSGTDDDRSVPQTPNEEPEILTQPNDDPPEPPVEYNPFAWGHLFPVFPGEKRKQIDLLRGKTKYCIGRNPKNDIVFNIIYISGLHAEINWDGSTATLQDVSLNGTFVNEERVGRTFWRILEDGTRIQFGLGEDADLRYWFRLPPTRQQPEQGFEASYDLCRQILGSGSDGHVEKCLERSTAKCWAAKIIPKFSNDGTPTGPRVAQEISILKRLSHPNVCHLKETFDETQYILILELFDRGDLNKYITSSKKPLSEDVIQHITYQLCLAVSYVHSLGITHRDLKPQNILLTEDNPPNVKVADFGLSKFVDAQNKLTTKCGTPAFVAPEVISQGHYDNLVDSWSIGLIVFHMLTMGGFPFAVNKDQSLPTVFLQGDRKIRISDGLKELYPTIIDFIQNLLVIDPTQRISVTDALNHPWLRQYVDRTHRDSRADQSLGKLEPSDAETEGSGSNITDEPDSTAFSRSFRSLEITAKPLNRAGFLSLPNNLGSEAGEVTPTTSRGNSRTLRPSYTPGVAKRERGTGSVRGPNGPRKRAYEELTEVQEGEEVDDNTAGDVSTGGDGGVQPSPSKRSRTTTIQRQKGESANSTNPTSTNRL
ncbi:hypothetical protein GYMLUDRAFT_204178 [Collybiopsis luxurians FD-317 M1]|uniref:Uncharacterized protein n=1 Tax=Collybiopsis luxurians FD-317 M1 TaxID=944289 RepID=A0A0D0C4C3_9AGAR|nr:hypothetical protein GYMLUDRAFT_204178 [Collybiopsis luxurians FD-317 M1]